MHIFYMFNSWTTLTFKVALELRKIYKKNIVFFFFLHYSSYFLCVFVLKILFPILIFWKMLKAQLKFNFGPTFLLSLKKKKTDVEERESLQLERE